MSVHTREDEDVLVHFLLSLRVLTRIGIVVFQSIRSGVAHSHYEVSIRSSREYIN